MKRRFVPTILFLLSFVITLGLTPQFFSVQAQLDCALCTPRPPLDPQCGGPLHTDCDNFADGTAPANHTVLVDQFDCSDPGVGGDPVAFFTTELPAPIPGQCGNPPLPPPVVTTPTPGPPPPVIPTLPPPPPGTFRIDAPAGLPVRQPAPFDKDTTIGNIINFAITILITIGIAASIIWLLYGAVKYITSGGDKAAIESAKTHIVSAIVGLIILVFTFVIINLVLSIFGAGTLSGTTFTIPDI